MYFYGGFRTFKRIFFGNWEKIAENFHFNLFLHAKSSGKKVSLRHNENTFFSVFQIKIEILFPESQKDTDEDEVFLSKIAISNTFISDILQHCLQ